METDTGEDGACGDEQPRVPRFGEKDEGEDDREKLARIRRQHRARSAPRPRQGDEAADSHPACATVANELPPRQAGWNHIDLAGEEDAAKDGDEREPVRVEHHVHRSQVPVCTHHALLQEYLHGVAADRKEEQPDADRRRLLLDFAGHAVGQREADQASTEQQSRDVVGERVRFAEHETAERHRWQQLARLDEHFNRIAHISERYVAADERGKHQQRDLDH
mmetsp:Transcript_21671/g.47377  ORF Transcript_21671/g.47377 Transcript_21671/m.47377 type:complete len:221 (-) Transcript_21671:539-1201(-)